MSPGTGIVIYEYCEILDISLETRSSMPNINGGVASVPTVMVSR